MEAASSRSTPSSPIHPSSTSFSFRNRPLSPSSISFSFRNRPSPPSSDNGSNEKKKNQSNCSDTALPRGILRPLSVNTKDIPHTQIKSSMLETSLRTSSRRPAEPNKLKCKFEANLLRKSTNSKTRE
ncbi:hypothetical protein KSP39_PZI006589 [Platanthera zijinensis]|uniref:Uncharacterized protein n=1 Tax=Platanthera zijinensis TaxID=2320716 RepID=A0AAP0GA39_9ASPA